MKLTAGPKASRMEGSDGEGSGSQTLCCLRARSDGAKSIRTPRKSDLAPGSALAAKAVAVKGALAGLLPPAIIGLGFLFTLAWSGILLWLFMRTVLALV
jgi:hypothetical protein